MRHGGQHRANGRWNAADRRARDLTALVVVAAASACVASLPRLQPVTARDACRAAGAGGSPGPTDVTFLAPSEGTKDRTRLDAWCRGVGSVVVLPATGGRSGPVDDLLVATWNNGVGTGDLVGFVGWMRDQLALRGRDRDHFVLLLQEVYAYGNHVPPAPGDRSSGTKRLGGAGAGPADAEIERAARALGLGLFYAPSMRNGRPDEDPWAEDRGNAILTPLPLEQLEGIELPYEAQRRVALAATVRGTTSAGSPWCVRLIDAHLDNRAARWGILGYLNSRGRRRQMRGLLATLDTGPPTILAGDLNAPYRPRELEPVLSDLRRRFPNGSAWGERKVTFRKGLFSEHLDQIMLDLPPRWRFSPVEVGPGRWGSDHYPLLTFVDIAPEGGGVCAARAGQGVPGSGASGR